MISIIIPLRNAKSTILNTLESLMEQTTGFDELIIIDNNSSDNSISLVRKILKKSRTNLKIISHLQNKGLAASYNEGIKLAKGNLIVTLHADMILKKNSLEKLVEPFIKHKNSNIVASSHISVYPIEIWSEYNFWQKCLFSRLAGKNFFGLNGQFDCFKKSAIEDVGFFNEKRYRTAGEDGDMIFKLLKKGQIIQTEAEAIHAHTFSNKFSFIDIIYKQAQQSESEGTLLRSNSFISKKQFFKAFFREILLIFLLLPYIRILSIILIILYSFYYTRLVFLYEYKNRRILILPFFNIFLLLVSFYYSLKGFIKGKQIV